MKNTPAWSYSGLTAFEDCPRRFWLTKVAKLVEEPPTQATDWGIEVHKHLELRATEGAPLPEYLAEWEHLFARLDQAPHKVFAERKIALTRNLEPTGFFDSDCWYRGVVDLAVAGKQAMLLDWKTGKVKDNHDQLKLFSLAWMAEHPTTERCRTAYVWLKFGKVTSLDVHRDQIPVLWQEFIPRVRRLEAAYDADKWPARVSGLCNGWCPATEQHCPHWRPKRSNR